MSERDVSFDEVVVEHGGSWAHVAPLAEVEAARARIGREFDRLMRGGALAENCEVAPGCRSGATWTHEADDGNGRWT